MKNDANFGFFGPVRFRGHFEESGRPIAKILLKTKPSRVGKFRRCRFSDVWESVREKINSTKYNGTLARVGDHKKDINWTVHQKPALYWSEGHGPENWMSGSGSWKNTAEQSRSLVELWAGVTSEGDVSGERKFPPLLLRLSYMIFRLQTQALAMRDAFHEK